MLNKSYWIMGLMSITLSLYQPINSRYHLLLSKGDSEIRGLKARAKEREKQGWDKKAGVLIV